MFLCFCDIRFYFQSTRPPGLTLEDKYTTTINVLTGDATGATHETAGRNAGSVSPNPNPGGGYEQALVSLKLKKPVGAEGGRTFAVRIEGG